MLREQSSASARFHPSLRTRDDQYVIFILIIFKFNSKVFALKKNRDERDFGGQRDLIPDGGFELVQMCGNGRFEWIPYFRLW